MRAVTKQVNGQWQVTRHDFMPFGEEVSPQNPPQEKRLFTAKERDNETGMDYFAARYYRTGVGRFTTVDPKLNVKETLVDPERWNRYAYARNNPLIYIDPDGRDASKIFLPLGEAGGNWVAAEAAAKKAGHTFEVLSGSKATTGAYNVALGSSDNRVFWVGHTGPAAPVKQSIALADGYSAGTRAQTASGTTSVSVNAKTVGLFGCNSSTLAPQYQSTVFVGVDSGPNHQTDVRTLDQAAALFVAADASGKEPAAAAEVANTAWNYPLFGINMDDKSTKLGFAPVVVVSPPKK